MDLTWRDLIFGQLKSTMGGRIFFTFATASGSCVDYQVTIVVIARMDLDIILQLQDKPAKHLAYHAILSSLMTSE